jgi:peptidyl-dipeptidase A
MSGALLRDPAWLTSIVSADAEAVQASVEGLRRAEHAQRLIFIRWGLVMCHFERDLYADPEADLDLRWWELVERFQGVAPPPSIPVDAWASKIHLAVAPAYYHNYLLGDVLAAQLRAAIERECGGFVGEPAAGEFMIDRVFRHGQLLRWDALIEGATGSPLSSSALGDVVKV